MGETGVATGPVVHLWLSYLTCRHWLVLPENRGRLRVRGVLSHRTPENHAESLRYNFGIVERWLSTGRLIHDASEIFTLRKCRAQCSPLTN